MYNATAYSNHTSAQKPTIKARNAKAVRAHVNNCFFVKACICAMIVFALFCIAASFVAEQSQISWIESLPRTEYTVVTGDSIDTIAGKYHIEGVSDHYFGIIISDINGVEGTIQPGDKLQIPTA